MSETPPISALEALTAEYKVLRPDADLTATSIGELFGRIHAQDKPLSALCISGGGIRSATFALGALQGLAEFGLLDKFDYLSTVSGGGYIGGWLTAWVQRAKGIGRVILRLKRDRGTPQPASDPLNPEAKPDLLEQLDPIQHLREYNNYLTPKLGGLSPDTWTLGATIVRNVFLNWLVLIPLLLFALMIPRFLLSIDAYGDLLHDHPDLHFAFFGSAETFRESAYITWILPIAAGVLFACSMINTLRYLPSVGNISHTPSDFVRYVLTPLIMAVLAFTGYDSLHFEGPENVAAPVSTPHDLVAVMLWTLTPSMAAWVLYLIFCRKPRTALLIPMTIAIVIMGTGTGAAAWLLTDVLLLSTSWAQYVTIAPPLLIVGFGLAGALFVGLSSSALEDDDREWLSRGSAYLMLFCAVWVAACAVVLLFPGWAFAWQIQAKAALVAAGGVTGWFSSFAGFRGDNKESGQTSVTSVSGMKKLTGLLLKIAPALFVMLLAIGLAVLTNALLSATGEISKSWWDHEYLLDHTTWVENLAWSAAFLSLGWLMARYININKFSLQGMYRDRLIRAYLGASNPHRKAEQFTGFCNSDNIQMHEIDATLRPFHVVNMTLNLVGGDRLAWQQRKAESMTATALHCGNGRLGYRESRNYGGKDGISLGTAITISGAAASPSMGYHSSPIVGFILTLFNLRLGAWLGNPGKAGDGTWKHAGPRSAVKSLVREAFGLTNDDSEYVYLSDGGHFENLGIYEMVLRRCRTIVVLDSGCDEKFTYEDLGNALRKIRIDLKIPITFRDEVPALRSGEKMKRCATATIQYSAVDGEGTDGELIYIKPMMLGNEPPDVTSYHCAHPSFPHQSTAEQWFDESQTESYRMLGLHSVNDILSLSETADQLFGLSRKIETGYLKMEPDPKIAKAIKASA